MIKQAYVRDIMSVGVCPFPWHLVEVIFADDTVSWAVVQIGGQQEMRL